MAKISIIIPVYNAEKYLNKCIDSCINQTFKDLEIIMVDDGSIDNSSSIIKNYSDKRIKYYKNTNHGIGYTRNFGIEKASSEFIMFLDSDDYLELEACSKLYSYAISNNLDLVICDFYRIIDNKVLEEKLPTFNNTTLKETPSLLSDINLSPWNKFYKKSLIIDNKIKFIENLKYEDAPFVSFALDKAKNIGKIDECLYDYCVRESSETTIRDERCFDIFKIIDIMKNYFNKKDYVKNSFNQFVVRTITNYTIQQRTQIDKKVGQKFIDEAFKYLKENVKDYKNSKYYKSRGFIRKNIERSKLLTKLYCLLYR